MNPRPHILPAPDPGPLGQPLAQRRSVRAFAPGPLPLGAVSALLYAAQGQTGRKGQRSAPSAGALYPLEVFCAAGEVEGLAPGVYRYRPPEHAVEFSAEGDQRGALAAACRQPWVAGAQMIVILCAVYERVLSKYGTRGVRYVDFEAGCASQNLALAAVARGLGSTVVGAFADDEVRRIVGGRRDERPVCVQPVGRPAPRSGL